LLYPAHVVKVAVVVIAVLCNTFFKAGQPKKNEKKILTRVEPHQAKALPLFVLLLFMIIYCIFSILLCHCLSVFSLSFFLLSVLCRVFFAFSSHFPALYCFRIPRNAKSSMGFIRWRRCSRIKDTLPAISVRTRTVRV